MKKVPTSHNLLSANSSDEKLLEQRQLPGHFRLPSKDSILNRTTQSVYLDMPQNQANWLANSIRQRQQTPIQKLTMGNRDYYLIKKSPRSEIVTAINKNRLCYTTRSHTPIVWLMASTSMKHLLAVNTIGEIYRLNPLFKTPEEKLSTQTHILPGLQIQRAITISDYNIILLNKPIVNGSTHNHQQLIQWYSNGNQDHYQHIHTHPTTIKDVIPFDQNELILLDDQGHISILSLSSQPNCTRVHLIVDGDTIKVDRLKLSTSYDGPVKVVCYSKELDGGENKYLFVIDRFENLADIITIQSEISLTGKPEGAISPKSVI